MNAMNLAMMLVAGVSNAYRRKIVNLYILKELLHLECNIGLQLLKSTKCLSTEDSIPFFWSPSRERSLQGIIAYFILYKDYKDPFLAVVEHVSLTQMMRLSVVWLAV